MKKNIIVKTTAERLDVFLSSELNITRSQAQKMIDQNLIEVNGKIPKKYGDKVKEGDKIACHCEPRSKSGRSLPTGQAGNPQDKRTATVNEGIASSSAGRRTPRNDIAVIAETPDYIIVNKPTGLLTHPTQADEDEALSKWLVKKYPELKKVGEDKVRPGIVHRLDKEASGLLVIARTQKMFEHLKEQFKNRKIDKEYFVLVHGKVEREEGVIDFPISRSDTADKMAALPKTQKGLPTDEGKEAFTEFLVEKHFVNFTLLRVKIHTGRTHQIRVHMLAYNHPVVGDPLYFQKKQKRTWDEKCGRLFLHCTHLGFTDLQNNLVAFDSPLPPELAGFLLQLK